MASKRNLPPKFNPSGNPFMPIKQKSLDKNKKTQSKADVSPQKVNKKHQASQFRKRNYNRQQKL